MNRMTHCNLVYKIKKNYEKKSGWSSVNDIFFTIFLNFFLAAFFNQLHWLPARERLCYITFWPFPRNSQKAVMDCLFVCGDAVIVSSSSQSDSLSCIKMMISKKLKCNFVYRIHIASRQEYKKCTCIHTLNSFSCILN